MKWTEVHSISSIKPGVPRWREVTVEVEQPFWYWLQSRIISRFDRFTYRAPVFKHIWRHGEVQLDKVAQWVHERNCNNDCGVWHRTRGPVDASDDIGTPGCVRMPLAARWDCWVYDITHRNAKMDYQDGRVGH